MTRTLRRARRRLQSDDGSAALYFTVIAGAILFATGLVVDGGRKMNGLAEAVHIADNAARACAQEIDPTSARAGNTVLDRPAAVAAGNNFLARTGHTGLVSVSTTDPTRCDVTVQITVNTVILPGPYQVQATQSARTLDERS